jgi:hypothetical protein
MEIACNTQADRLADEVVYYPSSGQNAYGMNVARMDAHGGWVGTAIDVVRFAVHVNGLGPTSAVLNAGSVTTMTTGSSARAGYAKGWARNDANTWWHDGSLPGTSAIMVRTASGLCWCGLINTRTGDSVEELDEMMWEVTRKVTEWPAYDLF